MIFEHNKSKELIILFLLINFLNIYDYFYKKNNDFHELCKTINKFLVKEDNLCDKWIVIVAFNPPTSFLINLEKKIEDWKIVVIGNNQTEDLHWNIFNSSTKLFYLSFEDQKCLNYNIISYLKPNSYYRKSIGYLYAIQHGAKEIYEIDEDLSFNNTSFLNTYFENEFVSYVNRNDSVMTNPYTYFGETNIWPRGFRIKDIGKQIDNNLGFVNSSNIELKPLIFQGIINNIPDTDSIFDLTGLKFNNTFIINYPKLYPIIYFPKNYIPINSKNTRYIYEIFPFLMFPISYNENIGDIWRGYIMQYFAWRMKGAVIYYSSNVYKSDELKNFNDIIKEKNNYFQLDIFLNLLNSIDENCHEKKSLELVFFLKILLEKQIIKGEDFKIFQVFYKDLINQGYNFNYDSIIEFNLNSSCYLKTYTKLEIYIPSKIFVTKSKNLKLIKHLSSDKIYNDILLIINYNKNGFLYLNNYIINLYKKYIPNIVFIYPSNIKGKNIISCNDSNIGFYSYICFRKVYLKYPNYKGYLFINDDLFLKAWELPNLNFSVPWFNQYGPLNKTWFHYSRCHQFYKLLEKNKGWENNITKFNGYFDVLQGLSDFYYIPNFYASKLCYLFDKMFKSKLFLECSIPSSMAILLAPNYQIIYIDALWGNNRKRVIDFLYSRFDQITVHPVKFSNEKIRKKVNQYIYFVNSIEY